MKTVILTEDQVKRVIDNIVTEQQASEYFGSTDLNKASHALLSKNFGLPDGAKNENFYYGANITDVIAMSSDPNNRSRFLSVFTPTNAYSENKADYIDHIQVNGEKLTGSGSMSFKFNRGMVYGAHNGLLALVRAMDRMGGKPGYLTINIGKSTKGKEAEGERTSQAVSFNSNRALNLIPIMNGIQDLFCTLAVSPQFIGMTTSNAANKTPEIIQTTLVNTINNVAMGLFGFFDLDRKDEIINKLTPMGLITKIDFDVKRIADQLIKLQSIPDMERNDAGKYTEYNGNKKNMIAKIGASYQADLVAKIKEAYIQNFKLYVQVYLPNSKNEVLPTIPTVKVAIQDLGEWHYRLFHSTRVQGSAPTSKMTTSSAQYKTGN